VSAYKTIDVVRDGPWCTIWFNQPERRNPLSGQLIAEILDALADVRDDRTLRAITFRGHGKVFSAGGDLKQFLAYNKSGDREPVKAVSREIATLLDAVANQPQLTIALVHGAAVAGGLGLMCACDYVLAHETTKFTFTETAIGVTPAQIAPFVLNRLGRREAHRLMLTAAVIRGHDALELGLVDEIGLSIGQLEAQEQKLRAQMMKTAPSAVATLKELLRDLPGKPRAQQVELAAENFTTALLSDEAREGVESFFEKRKPSWADT